ncbi:MAG: iron-containing alcohol dehydrogenase [Clostridiaceae bacterium]|nr:iron-containing alcohol dehydrogenase [Clostridiaceae bacterium]
MNYELSEVCPVLFGVGSVTQVGVIAKKYNLKKIMLVCDGFLMKSGIADKVIEFLKVEGIDVVPFDNIVPDPPVGICNEGAQLAKKEMVDGFVAIGGGSCIDTAKGINILTTNIGPLSKYFKNPAPNPTLPLIAIPTTSGTGSEVSHGTVITGEDGIKKAYVSEPTYAIVDPELTVTVPPALTAATGMDVFAHTAECILNNVYSPKGNMHSAAAIKLVLKWLPVAVNDGNNIEARTNMAMASNLGGITLIEGGVTFGHPMAHAMGSEFHLPHGDLCALVMPVVVKITALEAPEKVRELGEAMGLNLGTDLSPNELGEVVAQAINDFNRKIGIKSLKEFGVSRESLVGRSDLGEHLINDDAYDACYGIPKTAEYWGEQFVQLYDNYK